MDEHKVQPSSYSRSRFTMIRAGAERSGDVLKLLSEAAGWMESKGIRQWTPGQFNDQDIAAYFTDREVYLALDGETVAGMFTLQFSDPQYWGERNDETCAYLHRLAVAQAYRGGGLGRQLIDFALHQAQELGSRALRLDTVAHNVKLNRYYQSLGFGYMGTRDMGEGRLVNLYEHGASGDNPILLRYMDESDFQHMQRWSVSPEFLKQWAGPSFDYPLDNGQLMEYMQGANHPASSDKLIYCAVERAGGRVVGHLSLARIDRINSSARIGRVIVDPQLQGRGIGRGMIQEALRIGFQGLGLHRLSLGAFAFNTAAIRCYENAGFVREGASREAALFNGQYTDCIEFGLLNREWRSLGYSK
ncbi:GNAT family N-acetyltransferase [Paenibacillus sp. HW567]|uniref:GNAT family N-acetyltransferase n=1 Tax=Paenibacillus sp. HW567 TaxID=1034769 RepID=UPI00036361FA|nr:GNAT family N-acetyltransferase [Paenibacillus sp. HW567]